MLFKIYKSWESYDGAGSDFVEEKEFSSLEELFDYVELKEKEWGGIGQVFKGEVHIMEV